MIIQTAPEGQPRLAISMDEHTALAARFAERFGNAQFEAVAPRDLMLEVIGNHDKGWLALDADPVTDPGTGLPFNLVETPARDIIPTSAGSPDFNERRHPFCGLISSMHSWGLYNGRYGLSDHVLIDNVPPAEKPLAERMLSGELERQGRIKAQLAADAQTAALVEEARLFQNYKQLQFFDTLALYFNRSHEQARGTMVFPQVPCSAARAVSITIAPLAPGRYRLSPYPFDEQALEFSFTGRYIEPCPGAPAGHWAAHLAKAPRVTQRFVVQAG